MQSLLLLRALVDQLPDRLTKLSDGQVQRKPSPDGWSVKEELGHLLDSAANNHQRIVRAQLENNPAMPRYDGDKWVALHRYQERECRGKVAAAPGGLRPTPRRTKETTWPTSTSS